MRKMLTQDGGSWLGCDSVLGYPGDTSGGELSGNHTGRI